MTVVCPGFVQPFARKFQKPKATFGSGDLRRGSVPRETEGCWRDAKYRCLRVFANVSPAKTREITRGFPAEIGLAGGSQPGIVKTLAVCSDADMSQPSTRPPLCKGYRFPAEIISRCVWLYDRFGVKAPSISSRCRQSLPLVVRAGGAVPQSAPHFAHQRDRPSDGRLDAATTAGSVPLGRRLAVLASTLYLRFFNAAAARRVSGSSGPTVDRSTPSAATRSGRAFDARPLSERQMPRASFVRATRR
jgi:hypothetical protein